MRRVFVLVLAVLGSAWAQVHPAQNTLQPPTPRVDVDTDADPVPPINAMSDRPRQPASAGAFVSVSSLAIPERARKELAKANQALVRQNWAQARDRLNKAISFYPAYADAYNNLAVAYGHLGEADQERQALESAIKLDDHFALAHLNFGRMDLEEGKLAEAETELNRAVTLAPQNPGTFVVLSYCQFLEKHFDDAIATSDEVHNLTAPHAVAHRVAARAFEQKRQFDGAVAELSLFLREEPEGPSAAAARKELEVVRAAQRQQTIAAVVPHRVGQQVDLQ